MPGNGKHRKSVAGDGNGRPEPMREPVQKGSPDNIRRESRVTEPTTLVKKNEKMKIQESPAPVLSKPKMRRTGELDFKREVTITVGKTNESGKIVVQSDTVYEQYNLNKFQSKPSEPSPLRSPLKKQPWPSNPLPNNYQSEYLTTYGTNFYSSNRSTMDDQNDVLNLSNYMNEFQDPGSKKTLNRTSNSFSRQHDTSPYQGLADNTPLDETCNEFYMGYGLDPEKPASIVGDSKVDADGSLLSGDF
jgi:hypothetical protein